MQRGFHHGRLANRLTSMHQDRALAAVLVLFSAGYLTAALFISQPPGGYAVVGPRAFPVAIGIGLVVCALTLGREARAVDGPTPLHRRRLAGCALLLLGYLALFEAVGYPLATAAFVTLEARLLGSRSWAHNAGVGIGVTAGLYGLLDRLLGIPLPAGWLG